MSFQFYLNTRVDFGSRRIESVGDYCKQYKSEKVLIVTDENLIKLGLLEPVFTSLNDLKIPFVIYDGVVANPLVETVDQGADFAIKNACDLVLAVGGGSSMDTGKAIAVLARNGGTCESYLDGCQIKKEIEIDPLPIIAIPTTSGTGSEVSMYAVITDNHKIKDSISSQAIYPKVAIVDPELTLNLPAYVTACTGLDVFAHALEAYTSKFQNKMTNIWALEAMKLVLDHLVNAVNDGGLDSREKMALASVIAGSAMSHCGATIPHALGCPLSGHKGMPHGLSVGLLQIPMIDFNREELKDEFYQIMKYVKPEIVLAPDQAADALIQEITYLFEALNLKQSIDKNDIDDQVFENLVDDASIHGCIGLNKRSIKRDDIKALYHQIIK